jgi:hypothetical protein
VRSPDRNLFEVRKIGTTSLSGTTRIFSYLKCSTGFIAFIFERLPHTMSRKMPDWLRVNEYEK